MRYNELFHWQEIQADHTGQEHMLEVQKESKFRPFGSILCLYQPRQNQARIHTLSEIIHNFVRIGPSMWKNGQYKIQMWEKSDKNL